MTEPSRVAQAETILAGTGHRPDKLGGYGAGVSTRLVDLARVALMNYRPDEVVSGGAGLGYGAGTGSHRARATDASMTA